MGFMKEYTWIGVVGEYRQMILRKTNDLNKIIYWCLPQNTFSQSKYTMIVVWQLQFKIGWYWTIIIVTVNNPLLYRVLYWFDKIQASKQCSVNSLSHCWAREVQIDYSFWRLLLSLSIPIGLWKRSHINHFQTDCIDHGYFHNVNINFARRTVLSK